MEIQTGILIDHVVSAGVILFAIGSLVGLVAYITTHFQTLDEYCEKHDLNKDEIKQL